VSRRLKRRDTEIFSISFLDCITCGLGSVVLLLVLSEVGTPTAFEKSREELQGQILNLQQQLADIRGESTVLNRDLTAVTEQLSREKARLARLSGDLSDVRGKYKASKQDADVANKLQGQLVSAQQKLTDEMKRLLGKGFHRQKDDAVGGIPVDSEYVIFLIDTSGSMTNFSWDLAQQKLQETLNVYPKLKGFQVMNDQGIPMFSGYEGKWIQDTPGQRKIVMDHMRNWNAFSASSPAEGIVKAIRTYRSEGKKISIFVFGDEFTGPSIDSVVKTVDLLNLADASGQRLIRINALGFPLPPEAPQYTSIRFATLMRILCERNGGTFVGLQRKDQNSRFHVGEAKLAAPPRG
jgi:hypothetical protein